MTIPMHRRMSARRGAGADPGPQPDAAPPFEAPRSAPGLLNLLLEGRAPWEYAALIAASPLLSRAPGGDGRAVIVFPGLGAADFTTRPLRRYLRGLGYAAHAWEQGFNFGPRQGVLDACRARVRQVAAQHGGQVSLVGWSLGGIYAREMAKELPELARCVVTLGTPFTGHPKATNAWRFYALVSGQSVQDAALLAQIRTPPACPTTSIYSKSDGIVAWPCSINPPSLHTENIEVTASHIGMGANPLALFAVADRLAQDPKAWRPFDTGGMRRWFYRAPGAVPAA